jgi:dienelactone hydrolase
VLVAFTLILVFGVAAPAAAQQQKVLGHEEYEVWKGISGEAISRDGRWVLYSLTLQDGDPELVIRSVGSGTEYRVPRGTGARFSAAGGHVVAQVQPAKDAARQAKLDKKKPDEQPKADLIIVDLATGEQTVIERVKSFALPADRGAWVAYLLEKPLEAKADADAPDAGAEATPEAVEETTTTEPVAAPSEASEDGDDEKAPKEDGTTLIVRALVDGTEWRYESVSEYAAAADGAALGYLTSTADDAGDGAFVVPMQMGTPVSTVALADAPGHYSDLAVSETGARVAFLSDSATYADDQPEFVLHVGDARGPAAAVASSGADGLDGGWWVSDKATPAFSKRGARLFFGTAPRPQPEPDEEPMLDDEKVVVDIWNWRDPLLQPMQLLQAQRERDRTYQAVVHLDDGNRVVQLEHVDLPDVTVFHEGDGNYAFGSSGLPYRQSISWEFPSFADHVLVDVRSGERNLVAGRHQGPFNTSPDGGWAVWWDGTDLAWIGRELSREPDGDWSTANHLTAALPHPVHNEDHDWPYAPMPYGLAGWRQVDAADRGNGAPVEALIYDRFDIWAIDPAGVRAPRAVTSGYGRDDQLQLRYLQLEPDAAWISGAAMLLSGLHEPTKDAGFWTVAANGKRPPEQLVREPKRFGRPRKAEDADVLLYTRQDIEEFPNLWVTGMDFSDAQQVSDANPQQDDYNWATAELTTWRSLDGEVLKGIVHKPEDFDPTKQYPMIVYFYERNANNLHAHYTPTPHRSTIRPTWYASRGYIVFTPDITYQVGYPGESALKDVVSGVLHMIDTGYVDQENIGVQGHSWGGYQIAYLVTKTDIFKAAAGGAPVSNMTSAYGGIRWGSGMSRMFQYEKTQSRLGGTLWEAPLRYIENSPVFWADKVNTPLLMLHNDEDGAVPWEQGIEMFVALRRLNKPAWLVNYNGEPHWPTTYPNIRDWNIRMQQFFDHYLMDAPAPVWLAQGVPAVDKGKTLGLELLDDQEQR